MNNVEHSVQRPLVLACGALAALRAAVAVTPANVEALTFDLERALWPHREPGSLSRTIAEALLTAISRRASETAQKGSEP